MRSKILISVILLVIVMGAFMLVNKGLITGRAISSGGNDGLSIPLSEISENANFYEYTVNGVTVKFFAVKASDGSIKTAFDACDVCYGARKGYSQQGDSMVCNNCGNKYSISGLGTENKRGGGCWPGYLPSRIEGDNLIIQKSDLAKGTYRF